METNNTQKRQTKELKTRKRSLIYYLAGGVLTEGFITKQGPLILVVIVLLFLYISNGYSCQQKINEIAVLKKELRDLQYESLSISSKLTEHIKRSQVEELVKTMNLDLQMPNTPAIKIK